jgi:arylsulfatase A-like enzyme
MPGPFDALPARLLVPVFLLCMVPVGCGPAEAPDGDDGRPNVVVLLTDDQGYGDLGSYGHPSIDTPQIDSLASQGLRLTSFVTANWCTPSRTQLLTGRYASRVDFGGGTGAGGEGGLPDSLRTLAEVLNDAGYATGMAGKWHLGYKEDRFLPTNQGFDSWFGMPYSNDYRRPWVDTDEPLALYRGTEIVEHPVNQNTLTTRYTEEAVGFIREHAGGDRPFFFYLAYNMPHLPLNTAERFRGRSGAGLYGDVIEAIDWSVGEVMAALRASGEAGNTIVVYASDNGPWLDLPERMLQGGNRPWHAGSPGPLRGSKQTSYEGGSRVPAILHWPSGLDQTGVSDALVGMPDVYRTLIEAAGAPVPDAPLDGHDLMPWLTGEAESPPRERFAYLRYGTLEALRSGRWKLRVVEDEPQLFDLQTDPGERFNRAPSRPQLVDSLRRDMKTLAGEIGATMPNADATDGDSS